MRRDHSDHMTFWPLLPFHLFWLAHHFKNYIHVEMYTAHIFSLFLWAAFCCWWKKIVGEDDTDSTTCLSMLQFPVEYLLSVRQIIHFLRSFQFSLCETLIERAAIHCAVPKLFFARMEPSICRFTYSYIYSTLNVPVIKYVMKMHIHFITIITQSIEV